MVWAPGVGGVVWTLGSVGFGGMSGCTVAGSVRHGLGFSHVLNDLWMLFLPPSLPLFHSCPSFCAY